MPDPITTEDLYGGSSKQPEASISPSTPVTPMPIPVEETPEIPMAPAEGMPTSESLQPEMPAVGQIPAPPSKTQTSRGSGVLTIFLFIILFIAGIFLSSYIRPFISGLSNKITIVPTPTTPATPTPVDPFAGWMTYQVPSSVGLSYKLPPDVQAPTCDGTGCLSQGTYLPGGTRLTIAPKVVSQALSSLHGALITDAAGTGFTSTEATVLGHSAIEFTGIFAGRTSGGYGFTQMHGFMIEATPTITLEINHFTPTGVTADWARDEALFTQIVLTLHLPTMPQPTISVAPTLIPTTTLVPITTLAPVPATTSGY